MFAAMLGFTVQFSVPADTGQDKFWVKFILGNNGLLQFRKEIINVYIFAKA